MEKLLAGETITSSEKGNSMIPLLYSGEKHILTPISIEEVKVGDIVFCKVKGSYMTHLVTAKNETKGVQISNNHGYINGWTKTVFGKVIKIL